MKDKIKDLLMEIELETSKGEAFSLRHALTEDCCIDQLTSAIVEWHEGEIEKWKSGLKETALFDETIELKKDKRDFHD